MTPDAEGRGRPARPTIRHHGAAPALVVLALVAIGPFAGARAQAPGPESFAQEPRTPLDLWSAVDYLVRTGQAKQAVPYLDKLMKGPLDDATLIRIRDKSGAGAILRLDDDPATRKYARPLADLVAAAARRHATQPERIARFVEGLTKTSEEQDYAVARLREAGPHAVPFLVQTLDSPATTPEDRALLVRNLGRLDSSAVPALLAVLDSPDPRLAADAATALGSIGDARAVPFLTFAAADKDSPAPVRAAARAAVARITGRPFEAQPRSPARVLTDAAWSLHRHQVEFPGDPVMIWAWDKDRKTPVPREVTRGEAEGLLGARLARQALRLQPQDREAQVVLLSLALEKAIDKVGFTAFPAKDQTTFATAVAAGPSVLSDVLRNAIADGKTELAAAAATALGQVTDRALLASNGRLHPLVEALSAPGARLQLAAARALVGLAPSQPFPGSSRIVPTLTRFVSSQSQPRAVVIDGNSNRGSQLAGFLKALGYETVQEITGDKGFQAAAETADVELVMVSHDLFQGLWNLTDTLSNLKADARTTNLPVYIYGPRRVEITRANLRASFPGVKFLVQPTNPEILKQQLGSLPVRLSDAERTAYAQEAAALLARIAAQPNSPLAADLSAAEPALAAALHLPATSLAASTALGDIPNPNAQRGLADVVLDPSRPADLRRSCATQLARSIQRFGPLVSADQEAHLAAAFQAETDPQFRAVLASAIGALRTESPAAGRHRRPTAASPPASPAPASPAPGRPKP